MEPFVLLAFSPLFIVILVKSEANQCDEEVLFGRFLGVLEPKSAICPFQPQSGPCHTPDTLRVKGEMSNFEAKHTIRLGKKVKRTNGSIFAHVQGGVTPKAS